jgi:hypothetical protein
VEVIHDDPTYLSRLSLAIFLGPLPERHGNRGQSTSRCIADSWIVFQLVVYGSFKGEDEDLVLVVWRKICGGKLDGGVLPNSIKPLQ